MIRPSDWAQSGVDVVAEETRANGAISVAVFSAKTAVTRPVRLELARCNVFGELTEHGRGAELTLPQACELAELLDIAIKEAQRLTEE